MTIRLESAEFDKSLRHVTGKTADWEVVKDAVAFANARGGYSPSASRHAERPPPAENRGGRGRDPAQDQVDGQRRSPADDPDVRQRRPVSKPGRLARGRGLDFMDATLRVADVSRPVVGDEILRLANERAALPWETLTSLGVPRDQVDADKLAAVIRALRASDRVKESVKEKSDAELLDHYLLAIAGTLTNLGVLCVGRKADRARLGTAPIIQTIKYDEQGKKVNKWVWDDYSLSPIELIEQVWQEIPDFRERYELPDGLYRQSVPVYDEKVVRELLVNALVHRPYTQRGDIFLNLHPDRLEIVNPGMLPLGVTPNNVLHAAVRRNENLARLFHDLKLMEREGSGFDLMYEIMLTHGRHVPELREGPDRVEVLIRRRILKAEVIDLIAKADAAFQLSQRERICFGLIAQHDSETARELARVLELPSVDSFGPGCRLLNWAGSEVIRQAIRYLSSRRAGS